MQKNPGKLNKKIQIISYTITKDASGFEIKTENIVLSTYAQKTRLSGTEIQRSNSDFFDIKTRFYLRRPKILIHYDYVVKCNDKIYEIIDVHHYDKFWTEITTILVAK
jgi:head-tail adaptor